MYTVFRKLEDGDFLHVASRDELNEACQLAQALSATFPGQYEVRDSEGNVVLITE